MNDAQRAQMVGALAAAWLCRGLVADETTPAGGFRVGLAGMRAWLDDLQRAMRMSLRRRAAVAAIAAQWTHDVISTAALLEHVAGRRNVRPARDLRSAADAARRLAEDHLPRLGHLPRRGSLATARAVLEGCIAEAERMTAALGDAACGLAGLDGPICRALRRNWRDVSADIHSPSVGPALEQLLYLARAGAPWLRVLALQSLAEYSDARTDALLETSSYEPREIVRAAASWALERGRSNRDAVAER